MEQYRECVAPLYSGARGRKQNSDTCAGPWEEAAYALWGEGCAGAAWDAAGPVDELVQKNRSWTRGLTRGHCRDLSCSPVVLWSCGPVVLWYCGTMVLWYCGTVVLWYCVLWYCGTVVL
jgi:hypothetical protein